MHIESVGIKNYKCFKGVFPIDFDEGVNVLVGDNEVGKSTVLEAVHRNQNYTVRNFGDAKGSTFDRTLVYPNKPMNAWILNQLTELTAVARAKLYVGLTKAKRSTAVLIESESGSSFDGVELWAP